MGCCGNRPLPSLRQQVQNLSLTVANVVAEAIKTGKLMASKDLIEKRVALCQQCRHKSGNRCSLCGCYLAPKLALIASKCDIKKW